MGIEQELIKCLGKGFSSRAKGETHEDYLGRVIRGLAAVDETSWDKLSEAAQTWYNEAADAMNGGKPIPDFDAAAAPVKTKKPELESEEEEADEEPPEEAEEEEPAPAAVQAPVRALKPVRAVEPAKVFAPKKVNSNGAAVSGSYLIRRAFCLNPDLSVDDAIAAVKKEGGVVAAATVMTTRSAVRSTIAMLKELGKL